MEFAKPLLPVTLCCKKSAAGRRLVQAPIRMTLRAAAFAGFSCSPVRGRLCSVRPAPTRPGAAAPADIKRAAQRAAGAALAHQPLCFPRL